MAAARIAPLLLALAAAPLAGCTGFELTTTPEPAAERLALPDARIDLALTVASTFTPFVDGGIDLDDPYPRDGRLGERDAERWRGAFAALDYFDDVTLGDAPPPHGVHCRLEVTSGREPSNEWLRTASFLTLGLLPHRQREPMLLRATFADADGATARCELRATIVSTATRLDSTRLRRDFDGPERELARRLTMLLAADERVRSRGASR